MTGTSPTPPSRTPRAAAAPVPAWVVAVVVITALLNLVGAGTALLAPALLLAHGTTLTTGVRLYADYLVSRDLALAVAATTLLIRRVWPMLAGLLALIALVQIFDIVLDAATGRLTLLPGLAVLAGLLLAAATRLTRQQATTNLP